MNSSYLPYQNELQDCLWMWGHETGVYDGPDNCYNIPVSEPIGLRQGAFVAIPQHETLRMGHRP